MNTDNPPAFPVPPGAVSFTGDPRDGAGYEPSQEGMTLRDYFAGQALAGVLASPHASADADFSDFANAAYKHADAMLAARKEGYTPTAPYPPVPVSDLGDAVADMFDQLVKGNWTDDHGHPVTNNAAMIRLKERLVSLMGHIAQVRGNQLGQRRDLPGKEGSDES